MQSANNEAPHYAVLPNLLPLRPSSIQIFSSEPCSQIPLICVPLLERNTKFHTHTKQLVNLYSYVDTVDTLLVHTRRSYTYHSSDIQRGPWDTRDSIQTSYQEIMHLGKAVTRGMIRVIGYEEGGTRRNYNRCHVVLCGFGDTSVSCGTELHDFKKNLSGNTVKRTCCKKRGHQNNVKIGILLLMLCICRYIFNSLHFLTGHFNMYTGGASTIAVLVRLTHRKTKN
jgi:hypothetical protein